MDERAERLGQVRARLAVLDDVSAYSVTRHTESGRQEYGLHFTHNDPGVDVEAVRQAVLGLPKDTAYLLETVERVERERDAARLLVEVERETDRISRGKAIHNHGEAQRYRTALERIANASNTSWLADMARAALAGGGTPPPSAIVLPEPVTDAVKAWREYLFVKANQPTDTDAHLAAMDLVYKALERLDAVYRG